MIFVVSRSASEHDHISLVFPCTQVLDSSSLPFTEFACCTLLLVSSLFLTIYFNLYLSLHLCMSLVSFFLIGSPCSVQFIDVRQQVWFRFLSRLVRRTAVRFLHAQCKYSSYEQTSKQRKENIHIDYSVLLLISSCHCFLLLLLLFSNWSVKTIRTSLLLIHVNFQFFVSSRW